MPELEELLAQDKYGTMISHLAVKNEKRICLLVMDGLGDVDNNGKGTALQQAKKPNLDALAARSATGFLQPVAVGVTPGSGPGHLGLFGYDPLVYQVGRGVLSALGVEFALTDRDVAARLNFCTLDKAGNVSDRRAGRPSDDENRRILAKIRANIKAPEDVEVFFETESEHRAVMVLRGNGLDDNIAETDPQKTGAPPLSPVAAPHEHSRTGHIVDNLLKQVRTILADEPKINFILARGFAKAPRWPMFPDRFKLNPCAVAGYPMYRGVAKLVGIPPVSAKPTSAEDVCREAARALQDHTFVFAHFKYTDKTGEDGDLSGKIQRIEELDAALPLLLAAKPDALIITGDHSTPPSMKSHSWHSVPVILAAEHLRGAAGATKFDEIACRYGELGTLSSKEILPLAMAHTGKLEKFGA